MKQGNSPRQKNVLFQSFVLCWMSAFDSYIGKATQRPRETLQWARATSKPRLTSLHIDKQYHRIQRQQFPFYGAIKQDQQMSLRSLSAPFLSAFGRRPPLPNVLKRSCLFLYITVYNRDAQSHNKPDRGVAAPQATFKLPSACKLEPVRHPIDL